MKIKKTLITHKELITDVLDELEPLTDTLDKFKNEYGNCDYKTSIYLNHDKKSKYRWVTEITIIHDETFEITFGETGDDEIL